MVRYLVVGVDPGTTTGVAALDLEGAVVGLLSSRDMGLSNVVEYILSLGMPSMIACDVNPPPELASKLASKFGVSLFVPGETLRVSEKLELTRGRETSDAHQRDALAAALYAHNQYHNKLRKIESLGLGAKVKHFVLQGKSISAARSALEPEAADAVEAEEKPQPAEPTEEGKRIRDLEKRVKALAAEVRERDGRIRVLGEELAGLKTRQHIRHQPKPDPDRRVKSLESRLKETGEAEELLRRLASGEVLLVGVYPNVTGGLTLTESEPRSLEGVEVAFTSKGQVREYLTEHGVEVHHTSELREHKGLRYITAGRLRELKEKPPDIEAIITEYRRKRS